MNRACLANIKARVMSKLAVHGGMQETIPKT